MGQLALEVELELPAPRPLQTSESDKATAADQAANHHHVWVRGQGYCVPGLPIVVHVPASLVDRSAGFSRCLAPDLHVVLQSFVPLRCCKRRPDRNGAAVEYDFAHVGPGGALFRESGLARDLAASG